MLHEQPLVWRATINNSSWSAHQVLPVMGQPLHAQYGLLLRPLVQDGPIVAQSVLERTPSYPVGIYCDRSRRLVHGPL
jgi:hypothetical protein